jgi:hypothetical protein
MTPTIGVGDQLGCARTWQQRRLVEDDEVSETMFRRDPTIRSKSFEKKLGKYGQVRLGEAKVRIEALAVAG